jgi:hypothetical protein
MDGKAIYDCGGLELDGVMRTTWPTPSAEWSLYPAQSNVNLAGLTISNGTFVGTFPVLANYSPIGHYHTNYLTNAAGWSAHPATQTVNMAGFGLANAGSISLGGATRTNWPPDASSNLTDHLTDTNPHAITPGLIAALSAASNLSDVADTGAARANLGTLAAASNLADVADAAAARSNLGAAAQSDLDTIAGDLATHTNATNPHAITPSGIAALAAASNLSDVADAAVARANLGAAATGEVAGWSGYHATSLISRACSMADSAPSASGWLIPWTNAWGGSWVDASYSVTNLYYAEGDSINNPSEGRYLWTTIATMLTNITTSGVASCSFAIPPYTIISGVEINYDTAWMIANGSGLTGCAYYVVGSVTSDITSTMLSTDGSWSTNAAGGVSNLLGLSSENFLGHTNVLVCVYLIASQTDEEAPGYEGGLDYIGLNIYTSSVINVTNQIGLTGDGRAVIVANGSARYPLDELDALNSADDSYQAFSTNLSPVDGTCTVTYACGSLVQITPSAPITITFDNANYPTNGINRVGVEIWAGTNSIAFDSDTITNATAPIISSNDWASLYFRRTGTNTLWRGRQ